MNNNEGDQIEWAATYWREGRALEAGRVIFENVANTNRPNWASKILRLVLQKSDVQSPLFDEVIHTTDNPTEWGNAHRLFSTLRRSYLELLYRQDKQPLTREEILLAGVLSLAELVAKVTYNATDPHDEFDEDSGWHIAVCLKGFIDNYWSDPAFPEAAWRALSGEET